MVSQENLVPAAESSPAPMVRRRDRMLAISAVWLLFAVVSTIYYANFIHDVGATYWVMWVFVLPVALLFVLLLDWMLLSWVKLSRRPGLVLAIDCAYAISLWFVPEISIAALVLAALVFAIVSAIFPHHADGKMENKS